MGRLKLTTVRDLQKGMSRLAAVKSIDTDLDLGNGITVANYQAVINVILEKMGTYNTALSTVDHLYNDYNAGLQLLKDWNERILLGVAAKYGKDSSEYEMAGGIRKSERKKYTRRA